MKSISNDLIVAANEIDQTRNAIIQNLYEINEILEAQTEKTNTDELDKAKKKVYLCLNILEDSIIED